MHFELAPVQSCLSNHIPDALNNHSLNEFVAGITILKLDKFPDLVSQSGDETNIMQLSTSQNGWH